MTGAEYYPGFHYSYKNGDCYCRKEGRWLRAKDAVTIKGRGPYCPDCHCMVSVKPKFRKAREAYVKRMTGKVPKRY